MGPQALPNGQPYLQTFEGGNVDLRVPYIGYSSESESYTAAGISAYNALQTHLEKRMSHGLQVGASYTYLARHRRAKRHGSVLQRQQSSGFALRLRPIRLRPQTRVQFHLHVPTAEVFLAIFDSKAELPMDGRFPV